MPNKLFNTTAVAQQVELAIGRLDSLSTLPCVAAQFFPKLLQGQFSPSVLADIIESDPALTVRILSLIDRRGVSLPDGRFSLRAALDKLAAHDVRDAILSIKVCGAFDYDPEMQKILPKKGLLLHSLAVACCAKDIAELASPQMDSQLAYCAGLLHDIGKLALEETMPKSFVRIVEEAKSTKESSRTVEQKHLGADHTIIGKHLAQKLHLPNLIVLAIWLHHSETVTISQDMPEARIAVVVQLADSIARQSGIGQSGSFDLPEPAEPIAQWLAINPGQLQQIRQNLPEKVRQKSKILGLDLPRAVASYCDIVHATAAQLARDNTKLSLENQQLQSASSHLDFATDFLLSIDSTIPAVYMAENFAIRWQKFYQTGMVCLYLAPSAGSQTLETVVVENLSQSKIVFLDVPTEIPAIPKAIANNFEILNAYDHIDWLFEQLDVDFDMNRTKLVQPQIVLDGSLNALAEMAAGAAHELNNPLTVISGRTQLLAEAETDREKKQILQKIQENARQASVVIEDMMGFAEPSQPRPAQTGIKQIIDEAMQLASQKTSVEHINVQIEIGADVKDVLVDSAQIASAIANIISNAVESYDVELGPIKITADADESGDLVKLEIKDLGRGMDSETLRKAIQPFFCSRPAGRKRGMGLAYAWRFIQLNKGSLDIASEPGIGTTVIIHLPCK